MLKGKKTAVLALLFLTSLLLVPAPTGAQEPLRVVISEVRAQDFPYVKAYVTVTRAGGEIVRDLKQDNFTLQEDGRTVSVSDVQLADSDELSLAVALVLDASGSMKGEKLEKAKSAAIQFINSLGPNDLAAIAVFSETARVVQPFTGDRQLLINTIQGILPGSYTCLFDGSYYAIKETAAQKTDRRAVVVLTDGAECGNDGCTRACSIFTEDACIGKAKENNIPVHTIGFGDDVVADPLIRIAEGTGGTYRAANLANLDEVYQEIATQLKYEYVVTFESRMPHDRAGHNLIVDVVVGSTTGQDLSTFTAARLVDPPVLRFPTVIDGTKYEEEVDLLPDVISRNAIDHLLYQINDETVYTATTAPWSYNWDPNEAKEEENRFNVVAYDDGGNASNAVQFTLNAPPPPDEGEEEPSNRMLYYILGGVAALLLIGGIILFLTRRKTVPSTCPTCGRNLPRGATDCPFCASTGYSGGGTPATPGGAGVWSGEPATAPGFDPGAAVVPPVGAGGTLPYPQPPAGSMPAPQIQRTELIQRPPEVNAWLVVERGEHQGHIFRLDKEAITIGRRPENDIVLSDPHVSGQHAKVRVVGKEVVLHDLGSANGTLVDGKPIEKHTLVDNERVTIGNTTLVFKRTK